MVLRSLFSFCLKIHYRYTKRLNKKKYATYKKSIHGHTFIYPNDHIYGVVLILITSVLFQLGISYILIAMSNFNGIIYIVFVVVFYNDAYKIIIEMYIWQTLLKYELSLYKVSC